MLTHAYGLPTKIGEQEEKHSDFFLIQSSRPECQASETFGVKNSSGSECRIQTSTKWFGEKNQRVLGNISSSHLEGNLWGTLRCGTVKKAKKCTRIFQKDVTGNINSHRLFYLYKVSEKKTSKEEALIVHDAPNISLAAIGVWFIWTQAETLPADTWLLQSFCQSNST